MHATNIKLEKNVAEKNCRRNLPSDEKRKNLERNGTKWKMLN